MIRRRVVVRGTVQGVFFRHATQREARRHQVAGWVANRDDGTVEAVFEGEAADVEALVTWAAGGPPRARVDGLVVSPEEPRGERDFRIVTFRS